MDKGWDIDACGARVDTWRIVTIGAPGGLSHGLELVQWLVKITEVFF